MRQSLEAELKRVAIGLKVRFTVSDQLVKLVEECGEFTTSWAKWKLGGYGSEKPMLLEIADLIIVLESLKSHMPACIEGAVEEKLKKAAGYLNCIVPGD